MFGKFGAYALMNEGTLICGGKFFFKIQQNQNAHGTDRPGHTYKLQTTGNSLDFHNQTIQWTSITEYFNVIPSPNKTLYFHHDESLYFHPKRLHCIFIIMLTVFPS